MWNGWPADRVLFLFLGVVHLAVFVQVGLMHWRQNFRHWAMWVPVVATATLGFLALLLAWRSVEALRWLFVLFSSAAVLSGLMGSYYHIEGVGGRVDGYTLSNFMVGPPVALPLLVSALGALGLIVVYLL